MSTPTPMTIAELTTTDVGGAGAFDVLMRSVKSHLEEEFKGQRIRGSDYSTVYLGSMNLAMQTAMSFLLQGKKAGLELALLEKQVLLADKELEKADKELLILDANLEILQANLTKIPAEVALLTAQAGLTNQQKLNAVTEGLVLLAQECKLKAEYDQIRAATLRTNEETALVVQKIATERAQTQALGVDENSVIGKQKTLYSAQAAGFIRDAEQKVAKLLADTWSVRRTTDEGTVADSVNQLHDASVGRAITKLLEGVGA